MTMRSLLAAAACALSAGCAIPAAQYMMPLQEVRRPVDVQQRWGAYKIEKADSGYAFDDDLMHVRVVPMHGEFGVSIENKTDHSLQVIWDEMAYVGPDGISSKVSSGDTRIIDMGKSRTPTVIPSHAKGVFTAVPNVNVDQDPLNTGYLSDFVGICDDPAALNGKEVQLLVPVRIEETVNEYTFIFRLQDVATPARARASICGR